MKRHLTHPDRALRSAPAEPETGYPVNSSPHRSGLDAALGEELAELEHQGLLRQPVPIASAQGPVVKVDGRTLVCMASNNYLGLASHPDLVPRITTAGRSFGTGAGASRLVTGTMREHLEAESLVASFMGTAASLLFSSGYAANVGTLSALAGHQDAIFSDELNHASIIDGCRLSRASVYVYPHRDLKALEHLLHAHRKSTRRAIIVTEAFYSMDGDAAPLGQLRTIADRHHAWLMTDEAHALGVTGPQGQGLAADSSVRVDILVGTLGKALGLWGAFVAGSANLVSLLQNRARSFVYSTAPSPILASLVGPALRLVGAADAARARVLANARFLRERLSDLGYQVGGDPSPIVPVTIGATNDTMFVARSLFQSGVLAPAIRPPTVPAGSSRIRLTPMATHERAHLHQVVHAFAQARRQKGPRG